MRTRTPAIILIAAVVIAIIGGVSWIASGILAVQADVRQFREEHSEAKLSGKTADEIVAMYGKPFVSENEDNGKTSLIMYKQVKHGQYCGIHFKDGVAVRVVFWFQ